MGVLAQIRLALIALGVGVLAYFGIRFRMITAQRDDALDRAHDAEAYVHTRREVDNAINDMGDDPDAARRWLRERAKR